MRRLSVACVFVISSAAVLAAPADREGVSSENSYLENKYAIATGSESEFGFDLRAEREHQEFDNNSADIDTLSLQPWLQIDSWNFSLDVPWRRAEGEYFLVGNAQPTARSICQVPRSLLQGYPRLASFATANCPAGSATTSVREESGIGDITAFAHYGMPLDERGIWLGSVGLGYKADSGDVDKGMGSGTRDVMAEGILGANIGKFSATALAGYTWIVGGDASKNTDDYAYGTLDLSVKPLQWLALGVSWDYQQAYASVADDVQWITAYVGFKPLDNLRVRLSSKDYRDTVGYPNREYSGSVTLSF